LLLPPPPVIEFVSELRRKYRGEKRRKGENLVMSFSLPGHGYRSLGPGNAWYSFSLFPCSL
jgi:hypothetical protein